MTVSRTCRRAVRSVLAWRAGARLLDDKLVVGPEFYGGTIVSDGDQILSDQRTTPFEILAGAHYAVLARLARRCRYRAGCYAGVGCAEASRRGIRRVVPRG